MSLQLHQIILHRLHRSDDELLQLELADHPLAVTNAVEHFVERLHEAFASKQSRSYGAFSGEKGSRAEQALGQFIDDERRFVALSQDFSQWLQLEAQNYPFVKEGIVLFACFEWLAGKQLMMALLPQQRGVAVDDKLSLNDSQLLDIQSLPLAFRIDLPAWQHKADEGRYLLFLKGKAGRQIADFFLDFAGIEQALDAKAQTQQLAAATQRFVEENALDQEQQKACFKTVKQYCTEQFAAGNDVDVAQLSELIPVTTPIKPFERIALEDFAIAETFPPAPTGLAKIGKFVGQGGGVSLSFDKALLNSRVKYDAANDTLTLQGIPPNLRAQLRQALGLAQDE